MGSVLHACTCEYHRRALSVTASVPLTTSNMHPVTRDVSIHCLRRFLTTACELSGRTIANIGGKEMSLTVHDGHVQNVIDPRKVMEAAQV